MDLQRVWSFVFITALVLLSYKTGSVTAGDIVHDDENAPKKPGCENDFVLVCCFFCLPIFCFGVLRTGSCLIFILLYNSFMGFMCDCCLVVEETDYDNLKRLNPLMVV